MAIEINHPEINANSNIIRDIVYHGCIDYSFTNFPNNKPITVDFDYLCKILDNDTMTALTDKIKDLVMDALDELDEENED